MVLAAVAGDKRRTAARADPVDPADGGGAIDLHEQTVIQDSERTVTSSVWAAGTAPPARDDATRRRGALVLAAGALPRRFRGL